MYTLKDIKKFDIEKLMRRGINSTLTREYNADLRRLLPWPDVVNTKRTLTEFGAIIVTIRPQEEVDAHRHDEEECFIVISGQADLEIEGQRTKLCAGDVAYIPRFWMHQLINLNDEPFTFVDLYWDDCGRGFEDYSAIK